MRGWIAGSLFGALGIALACSNLPDLGGEAACGNRIIDPNEDCDTFGDPNIQGSRCVAPGLPNDCRFTCDPSGSVACPTGFFCAADAVCRAPSGALDTTPTSVGGPAAFRVLTGDFDGDHAADVVTVNAAATFVHYFDGSNEASRVPISSVFAAPAIGALGDGASDPRASAVVITRFQTGGNVRVWRGAADRTLLPTVYGSLDLTVLSGQSAITEGRVLPAFRAGQIGSDIFALVNPDGVNFEIDAFVQADSSPQTPQLPLYLGTGPALRSASDIAGEIPIGALRDPGAICTGVSPFAICDNFVLAYLGDGYATVYPTCDSNLGSGTPGINTPSDAFRVEPLTLSLGGDTVGGPAFLTNEGTASAIVVVGKQALHEFVFDCSGGLVSAKSVPGIDPTTDEVLAVGHLDDFDTCLDWVGTKAIHVVSASGSGCSSDFPTFAPSPWSDARIGDFNENGYADVVAISATALDFYNGLGTLLLNGQHTPLDGTPNHLTVGDFDGDFAPDFAFDTEPTSSSSTLDDLFVSFGQVGGFPLAPQSIGQLASIDQLRPAYFDYVLTGNKDFIETLFAIEKPSDSGHIIASLLQGGPDRLINSPFFLDPRSLQSIAQVAIGRFDGDSHPDIAGVSTSFTGDTKIWFVPVQGEAQIDVSKVLLSAKTELAQSMAGATAAIAIDADGKPGDELAVLQPDDGGSTKSCFFVTPIGSQSDWQAPPCTPVGDVRGPPILQTADLDGDGDADLIATYHDGQGAVVAQVVFNERSGTLSFANAATLPPLPNADALVAVTAIHFDVGGGTQLLVLGKQGLYVAAVDPTTHALTFDGGDDAQRGAAVVTLDTSAAMPTSVAAGDVDGDGVDDAIVGTTSGFWIYHGVPTH